MSSLITFVVWGLHNGYIRDECPKNFQWLCNFLATVFNRLYLIPAEWFLLRKVLQSKTCVWKKEFLLTDQSRSISTNLRRVKSSETLISRRRESTFHWSCEKLEELEELEKLASNTDGLA